MTANSTPPDVDAFRLMKAGRLAEAVEYAERATAGVRACVPAHGLLATILLGLGRRPEAESVIQEALAFPSGIPDAYDALAFVSLQMGLHERSNDLYRHAVDLSPGTARYHYNLASSERSFGRLDAAEACCSRAIELDRNHVQSYLLRSELRPQTSDDNHVAELSTQLRLGGSDDRRLMFLGYALAKELDDLARYDDAFAWFSSAASARRRHLQYDVSVDEAKIHRIKAAFGADAQAAVLSARNNVNHVFIVGLPRSGTTLVERILTGLPNARSNGETENFSRALIGAAPNSGGDIFGRAARADWARAAAAYDRAAGGESGETIIEKLPMNYLYLGAIHRALPEARLVLVSRSPIDTCFAMYRTLFGEAYPFSYTFEELARYYAGYESLIGHWRRSLGSNLIEVRYEELVHSPARVGAAVALACGLQWNPDALDVHRNAAVSLTASAAQVRRPIYGTSSGKWRHYRNHLGPLVDGLRKSGAEMPEDA